ncbi:homocysteine S-methyltransferase family protein [Nocardioides hwasunensis]|uniref:Homocysteine S-methyltransferase family protein n=1 Tax=Nocardioides hwasunensis TaxID=397258 RepID=A0ABR8MFT5_9ACTN|nr:homocysteine S-methyltransferase family protein [Nocardioides hwasunensis]MBD3914813.1 homocysteine S-methyltransferase family protein [Nocardioides hwasunensis]
MSDHPNPDLSLTERLDAGPVICAEGFLFELERRGYLTAGEFVPEVALEHPEALRALHTDFQHAGSDVVEAFTYNGHREKMRVIGKEELLEPLNRAALQVAREVADQRPGNFMAGNISNSNIWDPADTGRQGEVRAMFEEMVGWAVEEGADMIIGETFYYAGEALAALEIARSSGLPVVLTVAPMAFEEMADGVGIVETCQRLEQAGADVVGMNCFRGPETMLPWLRQIREAVSCHVAALPIPYRTTEAEPTFFNLTDDRARVDSPHGRTFPTALDPLSVNRYEMAAFAAEASGLGIGYLGVCCGASPMLVRQVAEAVGIETEASRYSERMENHFMYGTNERLPEHIVGLGGRA